MRKLATFGSVVWGTVGILGFGGLAGCDGLGPDFGDGHRCSKASHNSNVLDPSLPSTALRTADDEALPDPVAAVANDPASEAPVRVRMSPLISLETTERPSDEPVPDDFEHWATTTFEVLDNTCDWVYPVGAVFTHSGTATVAGGQLLVDFAQYPLMTGDLTGAADQADYQCTED